MVGGREAWSAWARQCGRSRPSRPGQRITEHWSFPGWTGLLQGGALRNNKSNSHTPLSGLYGLAELAGLMIINAGRSKHLSANTNHYRISQSRGYHVQIELYHTV